MSSRRERFIDEQIVEPATFVWRELVGWALWALLALAVVLHPLLLTSEYFVGSGTDLVNLEYPLRQYAFECWRSGTWPWWNPYIFNGLPLQTGTHSFYYPALFLGKFLPTHTEIWLEILFHCWLATLGGCLFLRFLGHRRLVAGIVGIGFALGGYPMAHLYAGHLGVVHTFAYLPWFALLSLVALRRRGLAYSVLAGALLALIALIGNYQMLNGMVVCMVWTSLLLIVLGSRYAVPRPDFVRVWRKESLDRAPSADRLELLAPASSRDRLGDLGGWLLRWVVILLTAALLSAFQWLPQWVTRDHFEIPPVDIDSWVTSGQQALTALIPHLFDRTFNAQGWTKWIPWEGTLYVSVPVVLAALLAFLRPWRLWILPAVLMTLLGLLSLGGRWTEILAWLAPTTLLFEVPARNFGFAVFFLCWLGALGLDGLFAEQDERALLRRRQLVAATFGICLIFFTFLFYANPDSPWWQSWLQSVTNEEEWRSMISVHRYTERPEALLVTTSMRAGLACSLLLLTTILFMQRLLRQSASALVLLVLFDLALAANPYLEVAPPAFFLMPTEVSAYLGQTLRSQRWMPYLLNLPANMSAPLGLSTSGGYDVLCPKAYNRAISTQLNQGSYRTVIVQSQVPLPLLALQGTSVYLAWAEPEELSKRVKDFQALTFLGEKARGAFAYFDVRALPRAFLVAGARNVDDLEVYQQAARDPRPFLQSVALSVRSALPETAPPMKPIRAMTVLPNELLVEAECDRPCFLVVTDAWWPGWTATVDGKPAPVERANGGLHRAVALEPGSHQVVFSFRPLRVRESWWVSLLTASVLGLWLGWGWRRSRA